MNIEKLIKIYGLVICFVLLMSFPVYAGNKADEAYEAYAAKNDLKLVNKITLTTKNGNSIVVYGSVPSSLYDNNLFYFNVYRTDEDDRIHYILAGLTSSRFSSTVLSYYSLTGEMSVRTILDPNLLSFKNFYYKQSYLYNGTVDDSSGIPLSSDEEQYNKALAFFQQPPPAPPEETEEPEEMGEIIWEILLPILKIGVLLAIFLLLCLVLLTLLKAFFQRLLM